MEQTAKKKKKKGMPLWQKILVTIILFAASCLLVYPSFTDSYTDIFQIVKIGGYESTLEGLTDYELEEIKNDAVEYNKRIYINQSYTPFVYQGSDYDDEEYDSILRVSETDDTMAYLSIPSLGIYVPVSHGTDMEKLSYQAGHMYGTSVPIGGENTHSVIAGHTGLTTTDLFTGLDKMEIGDEIEIKVLNEIHTYSVIEINVVLPLEVSPYLQIEEGKDLITLFTCTPYGVNSHRLLVKCERTGTRIDDGSLGTSNDINNRNIKAIVITILWGLIPFVVLFLLWLLLFKKKKKKDKNKDELKDPLEEYGLKLEDFISVSEDKAERPDTDDE